MKLFSKLSLLVAAALGATVLVRNTTDAESGFVGIGGLEPISIDGRQYFFGFRFSSDEVLTPLFPDAEAAAEFAAVNMRQRDGKKGVAYWLEQTRETLRDPSLSDVDGLVVELGPLRQALASLRADRETARVMPELVVPQYIDYLMEMNCSWGDVSPPVAVRVAAGRLGFDEDDISAWKDEAASMLRGEVPFPRGTGFHDAAIVFLWYFDTLVHTQRHGWNEVLALSP